MHTGYLTEERIDDDRGFSSYYYRVPNNEILQLFIKNIVPAYFCNKMKLETNDYQNFCSKLNEELNDDELFTKNVETTILPSLGNSGELNEIAFEKMIYAITQWHFMFNPLHAKYQSHLEKNVLGGRIVTFFEPNWKIGLSDYTIIIHEYKLEIVTGLTNVESAKEQAYWQIFVKNYLLEPISKYSKCKYQNFWKVKLRPIVFHKNENTNEWNVTMGNFIFEINEANNILMFFQNKIPLEIKNSLADDKHKTIMFNQRKIFLEFYKVTNIYEFIELIKNKKETEIDDFPMKLASAKKKEKKATIKTLILS